MDYLLTGRALCRNDLPSLPGGESSVANFLKMLTREELMVLLTACLLDG